MAFRHAACRDCAIRLQRTVPLPRSSGHGTENFSQALTIEGLPQQPKAGQSYELTIVLSDPSLKNAGFLLSIVSDGARSGEFSTNDDLTETNGAQARSTWTGSAPPEAGEARWQLVWTAPAVLEGPLRFDLWGNAGNYDLSPLGDRLHHRTWQLEPGP